MRFAGLWINIAEKQNRAGLRVLQGFLPLVGGLAILRCFWFR